MKSILFFSMFFFGTTTWGSWEDLTPAQKATVLAGDQVVFTQNVGTAWPKVWIYQYIDASPEQSAAVFADFDAREDVIEDVVDCSIYRRVARSVVDVECEIFVHRLFNNEVYLVRDVIDRIPEGYRVRWNKIRSTSSQEIEGWVTYTRLRRGTLMLYYSYVIPGSGMARAVRRRAMAAVSRAANSLTRSTVIMRRSEPAMLAEKVRMFRMMLPE